MSKPVATVAVTGATGYLGGVLLRAFAADGYRTIALSRASYTGAAEWRPYELSVPVSSDSLRGVDVLIHAAYDLSLRSRQKIWEVNVDGAKRLLMAAAGAGVRRTIVISSIAAFPGTKQLYGNAKLAIESAAEQHGAAVIRPGLIFGPSAGGMVGALRRTARFPIVPLFAAHSYQFLVHEADLAQATIRLAGSTTGLPPIVVANPEPVSIADVLRTIARADGRTPTFLSLPWRPAYFAMKTTEYLGVRLPFRADSLLGLAHPPPPPSPGILRGLGILTRRFTAESLVAAGLPTQVVQPHSPDSRPSG
jgi:nucleoside-diphosphate-sugar epimerase